MTAVPDSNYAKTADGVHIAYQVLGDRPLDLVFVPNWRAIDVMWEEPALAHCLERLASFSRLICFDKRGSGGSDPNPRTKAPTLESWMDDVEIVLEATGSERAAFLGVGDGAPIAILFAATHPGRVTGLVLVGAYARMSQAPEYPWGRPADSKARLVAGLEAGWGRGHAVDLLAPSIATDIDMRQRWARRERLTASPRSAVAVAEMLFDTDLRPALPAIQAPTLVLHRTGDRYVRAEHGRYLAEHIAGAKYVELEGADHEFFAGDSEAVVGEIEEFLTGMRQGPEPDRVLATLLFTDIVGSTNRAAELGDRLWRNLLDRHDAAVRRQLERFRGREIDTAGDGFLATFDGPGRAIRCGCAIRDALQTLGIEVRTGLHTGEIELRRDGVAGMAVHIGARVSALASSGEVLVSSAVPPLVAGSGIEFVDRGEHQLKGVPGSWRLFAVAG